MKKEKKRKGSKLTKITQLNSNEEKKSRKKIKYHVNLMIKEKHFYWAKVFDRGIQKSALWKAVLNQEYIWDTVYLCYCKPKLVTPPSPLPFPPWWGLRWWKSFILITLDRWKRHFWEKNYIENYFYLLKSTKSTKTTSQKHWRNVIWKDFFGCPYHTNGIKNTSGFTTEKELNSIFHS